MNAARRFYEARVLIVPHGPSARAAEAEMRELGLDGIMTVHPAGDSPDPRGRPVATGGWTRQVAIGSLGEAVDRADIVVLLATDLAEVDTTSCHTVSEAARRSGALIAALVIQPDGNDTATGNTSMTALRAAADMLVTVRAPERAAAFLDVLRGGQREPTTPR